MSRIKGRDTKPELAVRSVLHRLGYRFRLHRSDLPGRPDILLPRFSMAVFVHGCFWHRHKGCKYAYAPKSGKRFWNAKFERNVMRDRRAKEQLRRRGWSVAIIWECQTRDPAALECRVRSLMKRRRRAS